VKKFIIVLALLAAGCSGGSHISSGSPSAPLSARLILPSQTLKAGSSMPARVVVENNTGRAISVYGCTTLFQIGLANSTYQPDIAWQACLRRLTIPAGQSTWRAPIEARYTECAQNWHGFKPCVDGHPPSIPPGDYHAVLYQDGHLVQEPPAVTVRVTA
jgi:hypothetical protein